ncbi:MAG: DOPA 4,5-dioxygenase family protein [Burkholderiales bacterium]
MNREGLDVLVHPANGKHHDDHTRYALWLGAPDLERLSANFPENVLPPAQRA